VSLQSKLVAVLNRYRNPYVRPTPEWTSAELVKGGYRMVMNPLAGGYAKGFDRNAECLFLRVDWPEPRRFRLADQSELFNISGLWWKPL